MSLFNTLGKLNDNIIKFLETPIIKYGFLIIIISQIIAIKHLSTSYLKIFDDNYFKVIYAFFIAYYACFDPIYAIALTTLMIISIQEVHHRNATHNSILLSDKLNNEIMLNDSKNQHIFQIPLPTLQNQKLHIDDSFKYIKTSKVTTNKLFDNDELVYNLINKHSLQKQPDINDNLKHEYEFCDQPAFKTITNNLNSIQYNELETNQNNSMQGLHGDILNIQGLPNGFDQHIKLTNLQEV